MSEAIKPKCCGQVSPAGAWGSYPCGKNASMEHDGKHYCKTHHPPTVQAKQDASRAKWRAQWDALRVHDQAARDAAAEQKRRADAYDQLVERVKELEDTLCSLAGRFLRCAAAGISAAEAYDSFYQDDVTKVLSKALPNAAAKEARK